MTDIEIANSVTMKPITEIAGKLGIPADVPVREVQGEVTPLPDR